MMLFMWGKIFFPHIKIFIRQKEKVLKNQYFFGWGERIRTFGMTESESVALPLGDTPLLGKLVGIDGFEPSE